MKTAQIIVAIATAALAVIAIWNTVIIEQNERAWLYVSAAGPPDLTVGKWPRELLRLTNTGHTPALNITVYADTAYGPSPLTTSIAPDWTSIPTKNIVNKHCPSHPTTSRGQADVFPGEVAEQGMDARHIVTPEEFNQITLGGGTFYSLFCFDYDDGYTLSHWFRDEPHRTAVCFYYNFRLKRMVKCPFGNRAQ